jgi:dolichol-phosphate mannosyltransferase
MTAQANPSLSIVIPAHNEEANIGVCIDELLSLLIDEHRIATEVIVVNDNSSDGTEAAVKKCQDRWPTVRLIRRAAPSGFGRAIRAGLRFIRGDVVVIYMADRSDHPADVFSYHRSIGEGYDCVFGSRFIPGAQVQNYPRVKLIVNRIVNRAIQWLFWTSLNDLTNAFKAYRREVVERCGPYRACHFNITLEMSLSALISGYRIAQIPIGWEGRTWGSSKLRMREMGRRYLCTLIMLLAQRILMSDDVASEKTRDRDDCVEIERA